MPPFTLYTILGVSHDATESEIRKAYRQRALATHPDKVEPTAPEALKQAAEGRFRQVCAAFETLSDSARRRAYDLSLRPVPTPPSAPNMQRQPSTYQEQSDQLMKARQEWAKQAEEKQQERMQTAKRRTESISSLFSVQHSPPVSRASSSRSSTFDRVPESPSSASQYSPSVSTPDVTSPLPSSPISVLCPTSMHISEPEPVVSSPHSPRSPTSTSVEDRPPDASTSPSSNASATATASEASSKRPWYSRQGTTNSSYFPRPASPSSMEQKKPWYARKTTVPATKESKTANSTSSTPANPPPSTQVTGRALPKSPPPPATDVFASFFDSLSTSGAKAGVKSAAQWEVFADLAKGVDAELFRTIDQTALADKIFNAMQAKMPQWEARRREAAVPKTNA